MVTWKAEDASSELAIWLRSHSLLNVGEATWFLLTAYGKCDMKEIS